MESISVTFTGPKYPIDRFDKSILNLHRRNLMTLADYKRHIVIFNWLDEQGFRADLTLGEAFLKLFET